MEPTMYVIGKKQLSHEKSSPLLLYMSNDKPLFASMESMLNPGDKRLATFKSLREAQKFIVDIHPDEPAEVRICLEVRDEDGCPNGFSFLQLTKHSYYGPKNESGYF